MPATDIRQSGIATNRQPAHGASLPAFVAVATLAAATLAGPSWAQDCFYDVEVLDLIPNCGFGQPGSTTPRAIANNGWITGRYPQCNGSGDGWAMLNTGGTAVQPLIPQFADVLKADGASISAGGHIVGSMVIDGVGSRGFVYNHGSAQWWQIDPLEGGNWAQATAVNSSGLVCGWWGNSITGPTLLPFIWSEGVLEPIHDDFPGPKARPYDINDDGVMTGWTGNASTTDARAFLWDSGDVTLLPDLPDTFTSTGVSINANNAVAGTTSIRDPDYIFGRSRATFWKNGEAIDLGVLPGFFRSHASDVNIHDVVVGWSYDSSISINHKQGYIWQDGVMTALDDLIDPALEYEILYAYSINDDGKIAAVAKSDADALIISFAVVLSPPNPADTNGDCIVNVADLLILLSDWGFATSSPADFDANEEVNVVDLLFLLSHWGD